MDGGLFHKPRKPPFKFKQEPLADSILSEEVRRSPEILGRALNTDYTERFFNNMWYKVHQRPPENVNIEIKGQTRSGKSTSGLFLYIWLCKAYDIEPTVDNILANQSELLYKLKDSKYGESFLVDEQTPETYTEGILAESEQLSKNINICAKKCNNLIFICPPKFMARAAPFGLSTIGKDIENNWNKCFLYDLSDRRTVGWANIPMGYVLIPKYIDKKYFEKPREKWSDGRLQTYLEKGYEYMSQLEEDYEAKKDIWIEEVRALSGNMRNKRKEELAEELADDPIFLELKRVPEKEAYIQMKINHGEFMEMAKTEITTLVHMANIKQKFGA